MLCVHYDAGAVMVLLLVITLFFIVVTLFFHSFVIFGMFFRLS